MNTENSEKEFSGFMINTLQKIKLFTIYKQDVTFWILNYFRKPKMSVYLPKCVLNKIKVSKCNF